MYSTPFDALLRQRFAFDLSLVSRRAIDLSTGNIATGRPVNPTALMTSRPLNKGSPAAVSGAGAIDCAVAIVNGAIMRLIAIRAYGYGSLRMSMGVVSDSSEAMTVPEDIARRLHRPRLWNYAARRTASAGHAGGSVMMRLRTHIVAAVFGGVFALAVATPIGSQTLAVPQANWREVRSLRMGRFRSRIEVSSARTIRLFSQLDTSRLTSPELAPDSLRAWQRFLFSELDKPSRREYTLGNAIM